MKPNAPKTGQLPSPRKATLLESVHVLPPERTRHTSIHIDITLHRVITALAFLILAVGAVVWP